MWCCGAALRLDPIGKRLVGDGISRKEQLARKYEQHHAAERGAGFAVEEALRGRFFSEAIGTGKMVVDLGCRDGTMALAYSSGNRVVGLDIDRGALARARSRGLEPVWADLNEPLPLDAGAFDAVVAGELLEHLPAPEALLDEAVRILKPSGVLVGSVPNSFRLKNRLRFLLGRPVEPDPTHLHRFSPDGLRSILASRFELVRIHFAASRFLRVSPRLFANTMLFLAERPLPGLPPATGAESTSTPAKRAV